MALVKKLRALSLMGFFHFSVSFALLTSRVSSLLWEFTNSLICNYGSLHLSLKFFEFFRFTQTNLASLIKKPRVFYSRSQILISFIKKKKTHRGFTRNSNMTYGESLQLLLPLSRSARKWKAPNIRQPASTMLCPV